MLAIAITSTGATAAQATPTPSDLTKQITEMQSQLEKVTEAYNKMNIDLAQTVADEKSLAASLGPAKDALKAATAQMQTIAATYYMTGQVGTVNVLLEGTGGATDMLDRMNVIDQMSRRRQRDIANFSAVAQNYTSHQNALQTARAKQAAQVKQLATTKAGIEAQIKVLLAKRTAAYGRPTDRATGYSGPVPSISGSAGKAVAYAYAKAKIPAPYHFGASGPDEFDCSGLTMAAWAAAGKSLPHNAAAQYNATARVSRGALQPGDLVFYSGLAHVGIYVGGGQIIDAPHTGAFVNARSINIEPIYGYGRVE